MKFTPGKYLITGVSYEGGFSEGDDTSTPVIKEFKTAKSLVTFLHKHCGLYPISDEDEEGNEIPKSKRDETFFLQALKDIEAQNGDGCDYIQVYYISPKFKMKQLI